MRVSIIARGALLFCFGFDVGPALFYRPAMNKKLLCLLFVLLNLVACTKKDAAPKVRELRIFTWSDYLRPELIAEFEKENNAKVKLDFLSSNEELLAKLQLSLQSSAAGYDLIQPSDYMVVIMKKLDLLQKVDKAKLSFLKDFDPSFLTPSYDPNLEFSIPFAWGTTGLAINTKLAPKLDPNGDVSWKELFENPLYKGKTSMLEDPKEALHLALRIKGKALATATAADIDEAFAYLKKHKDNLRAITTEVRPLIEAGDCAICHAYSGEVLTVGMTRPEIKYVVPKEGATLWVDNFAIPKNAQNLDLAYAFLNKLLSAEGAKQFTEATHYATPNLASKKLLPKEFADNLFIFPDAKLKKRLQMMTERTDVMSQIEKGWTELKSE